MSEVYSGSSFDIERDGDGWKIWRIVNDDDDGARETLTLETAAMDELRDLLRRFLRRRPKGGERMPEWGEPLKGESQTHRFETEPVLVGTFQKTDEVSWEQDGEQKRSTIHRFLDESSMPLDCWGTTDLDRKLRGVTPGSLVRIQYLGDQETASGFRMKMFQVQVAADHPGTSASKAEQEDDIPF